MRSGLDYRPELDGLRAIAVVPVILFHLGLPYTPGGFVGVDVFFVLSGYLITQQIAVELDEKRFSLLDFYDRRIRRLLPALFAMLFVSTLVALVVLLPRDLDRFGESLIAAALSISNFHFWNASDYFAPAAETMPLLHTWSLAVEEQFYLLFPPLLILVWRFGRVWVRHGLMALAVLSFVASMRATRTAPDAAFYLLPHRAWELLLGSLLALAPAAAPIPSWLRTAAATLGLGGIGVAVFSYHSEMRFPGLAAALPVLGSALIIWAGQASNATSPDIAPSRSRPLVFRFLTWRPLVFVGLISYSLYLWHWPLVVFARYSSTDPISTGQAALIAIATFCIAYVSWKFIEQPLRRGGSLWRTPRLRVRYSVVAIGCVAFLGTMLDFGNGFPWLQPKTVLAVVDDEADRSPLRERCHIASAHQGRLALSETCLFGSTEGRRVVVFADSHGAELSYALSEVVSEGLLQVRQITASGCAPALGYSRDDRPDCARHTQRIVEDLAESPHSTIVIGANYFAWAVTKRSSNEAFWRGLDQTIARLRRAGHDVILLGGWPPHPNGSLPTALAKHMRSGHSIESYEFSFDRSLAERIDARLALIADQHAATYIPLLQAICGDSGKCRGMANGHSIYFDEDHLSVSAARRIVSDPILPALRRSMSKATEVLR